MSQFHTLTIKSITKETADAVSIAFNIPDELKTQFAYKSGQYITFKINLNGEILNRSYSLCSSDAINESPAIGVKVVKGGKISNYLNNTIKVGDSIEAMLPTGKFFIEPKAENKKHYLLFGGGSGITPLFSIVKTVLNKEPNSKIDLIYSNYNSDSVIFKNQLLDLASKNSNRFKIQHVFDQPKKSSGFLGFGKKAQEELPFIDGMLHQELVRQLVENSTKLNFENTEFFICGPLGLMDTVSTALKSLSIPADKIHREYFTEKSESSKKAADVGSGSDEGFTGNSQVTIISNRKEVTLEVNESKNLLDAAIDANLDPPFACMVGDCSTCRAKIIEGKVHMNDSIALTPKEIEAGYILTCQSHPKTSVVKITYDA